MVARGLLRWLVFALLVGAPFATGALAEGPDGVVSTDDPSESSVEARATRIVWSSKVTGDFALRFTADLSTHTICQFDFKSGGYTYDNSVFTFTSRETPGGAWTAFADDFSITSHAGSARFRSTLPGNVWASHHTHVFSGAGEIPFLYVGSDLTPWNNDFTNGASIVLDLKCNDSFTVTDLQGGKTILAATPSYMTGGAGAHVFGTAANAGDSMGRTFSEPDVVFRYRSEVFHGLGILSVDGPAGADGEWFLYANDRADLDGGSGSYRADLTRVSAGGRSVLVFAGLEPVSSFDDAAAL